MNTSSNEIELLGHTKASTGETLSELSEKSPVLLVMLRHEGCSFCRNAMSDIARLRDRIEAVGTRIVLGHMGDEKDFTSFAARYGLAGLPSVADPHRSLYKGLGLRRGSLLQLLSPHILWSSLKSALKGHFPGKIRGDVYQLPGAFLIHHGKIIRSHTYRDAADRPDYVSLATP